VYLSCHSCKILSRDVCVFNLVWILRDCIKGDCSYSVVSFSQLATTVVTVLFLIYDILMMAAVSSSSSVTTLSTKNRSSMQAMRPPSSTKVAKSSNRHKLKTQVSIMLSASKMTCWRVCWWKFVRGLSGATGYLPTHYGIQSQRRATLAVSKCIKLSQSRSSSPIGYRTSTQYQRYSSTDSTGGRLSHRTFPSPVASYLPPWATNALLCETSKIAELTTR